MKQGDLFKYEIISSPVVKCPVIHESFEKFFHNLLSHLHFAIFPFRELGVFLSLLSNMIPGKAEPDIFGAFCGYRRV